MRIAAVMIEQTSSNRSHGGLQGLYRHQSSAVGMEMNLSVFVPDHAPGLSSRQQINQGFDLTDAGESIRSVVIY